MRLSYSLELAWLGLDTATRVFLACSAAVTLLGATFFGFALWLGLV